MDYKDKFTNPRASGTKWNQLATCTKKIPCPLTVINIFAAPPDFYDFTANTFKASGLHVTYWRHSGESGGPIYHQYPPFFYSELRNFAVLFSPRKSALGFRSPDPEDVKGKLSRRWGINIRLQQAKPGRGGSSIIQQRKVCWRLRDDTMF